ncbi:hypothetical protein BHE74_00023016, partial [Ensete ventricosum]
SRPDIDMADFCTCTVDMTQVRSTRHSCSKQNIHHVIRTTDDVEAYDSMVSDMGIKDLKYEPLYR